MTPKEMVLAIKIGFSQRTGCKAEDAHVTVYYSESQNNFVGYVCAVGVEPCLINTNGSYDTPDLVLENLLARVDIGNVIKIDPASV